MKEIKTLNLKELDKIKNLTDSDLKKEFLDSSKNLYLLRMKKNLGEQKQTHLIKVLRRYIAQLKTVAGSKGINI